MKRLTLAEARRPKPRATRKALREGGRVRLRWYPSWSGKIVRLGPEVSEVRFDAGNYRFIVNEQLEPSE